MRCFGVHAAMAISFRCKGLRGRSYLHDTSATPPRMRVPTSCQLDRRAVMDSLKRRSRMYDRPAAIARKSMFSRGHSAKCLLSLHTVNIYIESPASDTPLTILHSYLLLSLTATTAERLGIFIASNRHRSTICAKLISTIGTNITLR
jgi:hypothetical protein